MKLYFRINSIRALLEQDFNSLEGMLAYSDRVKPAISQKGIAWHLDHTLMVVIRVCDALVTSEPNAYKRNFNMRGLLILHLGHIPRGAAKSPASVIPEEEADQDALRERLKLARQKLDRTASLHKHAHFYHPQFGPITLSKAMRFLQMHTRHHLRIMQDIIRSQHTNSH